MVHYKIMDSYKQLYRTTIDSYMNNVLPTIFTNKKMIVQNYNILLEKIVWIYVLLSTLIVLTSRVSKMLPKRKQSQSRNFFLGK